MSMQVFRYQRGNLSANPKPISKHSATERAGQLAAPDRPRVSLRSYRHLALMLCGIALLFCITSIVTAQTSVAIRVLPGSSGRAVIEGSCAPTTTWSFRDSYAGVLSLGSRVEGFRVFDSTGTEVPGQRIAPGQFKAATAASRFRYEITLAPPMRAADAARVSWLNGDRGLLMLGDLLPAFSASLTTINSGEKARTAAAGAPVEVRLSLPDGWIANSNEGQKAAGEFEFTDADSAVLAIGNHLRISRTTISGVTLSLVAVGEWAFTDSEALELAGKVLKAHRDVFAAAPSRQATLNLFPFPQSAAPQQWSAETRGSSVTLVIGRLPSKIAALAQLSVPLTHELLHLWVPNGLTLEGDYDWFYEGFTIYQAARIGVRLDLLTFQEFLNAISRAYDAYTIGLDHDRWSLVEASKRRWTGGESSVYSKSLVIAFLYDLNLRTQSRGKRSLDDVYRDIFRGYRLSEAGVGAGNRVGQGTNGNEVVINALDSYAGVQDFDRLFIRNPLSINLAEQLAPFGLRVETFGLRTRISVSQVLTRQQRDLLHNLGYNDSVRSPGQRKPS
jgi:hypothetical protein